MLTSPALIRETFPVGPLQCNYTITGGPLTKKAIVIDPGGDHELIPQHPGRLGLQVISIIHTHTHLDHFLAPGGMKKCTGASLHLYKDDQLLWDNLEMQCQLFGVLYTPVPAPDHWLVNDEELACGCGVVPHTPGHASGSMSFWFPRAKPLIAGDTLFRRSIGHTDLWGNDSVIIQRPIRQRLYNLDGDATVATDHGPNTALGEEVCENPFVRDRKEPFQASGILPPGYALRCQPPLTQGRFNTSRSSSPTFTSRRLPLAAAAIALALLVGCTNNNPYDTQSQSQGGVSKTAGYGGLGVLAGIVAGAAINHNNRGKGALIGAVVAGAAVASCGYYVDKQEAELRRQIEGTGVEVQHRGDDVKLIILDNITFVTDSANIAPNFYAPLNNLTNSFKQYNQNTIGIVGCINSTSDRQHNMGLSQHHAQGVTGYLTAQGIDGTHLSTRSMGLDQPIMDNPTTDGHAQNRCVEVSL